MRRKGRKRYRRSPMTDPSQPPTAHECAGPCRDCGVEHALGSGDARRYARALIREFEALGRLDYLVPEESSDPALAFDQLFPGGHGNMFGVLECEDGQGETVVLRAFSSLKRGIREIDGWVPPILSADTYYGMIVPAQRKIEELTSELDRLDSRTAAARDLLAQRKSISRALLADMQGLYRFLNFRGQQRTLHEAYWPARARLPGGIGECCAPKLLDHAAARGLRPRGIAEFYWGDSDTKRSGDFYPSCETRCRPILGFMLCGLDERGR
jgi:hypothetical protein